MDFRSGFNAKLSGAMNKWMCFEYGKYGRNATTAPIDSQNATCSPITNVLASTLDHKPVTDEMIGCQLSVCPARARRKDSRNNLIKIFVKKAVDTIAESCRMPARASGCNNVFSRVERAADRFA